VYLAGLAFTMGSALLFGMVPAWQACQSSPLQMMKGGPADAMRLRRLALRDLLLGAQIAICTLLVTGSLVAVRGMVRALHVPLGFQPQGAMLVDLGLSQLRQAGDHMVEKQKAIIEAVRSIPGVTAAGTVNRTPFTGGIRGIPISGRGRQSSSSTTLCWRHTSIRCRRDTWRRPAPGYWAAGMFPGMTPPRRRMWRS